MFCKYTPAVLKKELWQAKKLRSEPGFSGLEMDDEDISNLPIFLTILSNQANRGSI